MSCADCGHSLTAPNADEVPTHLGRHGAELLGAMTEFFQSLSEPDLTTHAGSVGLGGYLYFRPYAIVVSSRTH